ncbi:efflux transporter outer membrane subunit [Affinibrenneria salicis]|uniref:Efflux transporter outer membrane subunit n=1 Tax=Affinibrenneria salicis TaxID=2590031 RepID=A0A5J5G3P8_9GAMM|nr:efflux transporter outer membrane subunit [Affinibrenneria salicis]
MIRLRVISLSLMLAGCASLDPVWQRPAAPVPAVWPGASGQTGAELAGWKSVIGDARLRQLLERALRSNRDVQKALADMSAARALYREQRGALFPALHTDLSLARSQTPTNGMSESAQAEGAISGFELDLFGRNRSLTRAARETWLASEYTAQSARLTLIADTSRAWLALAAANSNLALARNTRQSAADSLAAVQRRQRNGLAAASDASEAQTIYQQARAGVAAGLTQVAQSKNALTLLTGSDVPDALLPGTLESLPNHSIALLPAGVSSSVLLRRPDVREAEHNLKSANASIGAARASFFPTITLTASAGAGSDSLANLFSGGSRIWAFSPSVTLPLFAGGGNLAQLRYAQAQKQGRVASYEKTIQTAFRDVADALARRATLSEQLDARQGYVAAAQQALDSSTRRYQTGAGDYLNVLTARRPGKRVG